MFADGSSVKSNIMQQPISIIHEIHVCIYVCIKQKFRGRTKLCIDFQSFQTKQKKKETNDNNLLSFSIELLIYQIYQQIDINLCSTKHFHHSDALVL